MQWMHWLVPWLTRLPMELQPEKKLQRILQIFTGVILILVVLSLWFGLRSKTTLPETAQTSVLQNQNKVRRPLSLTIPKEEPALEESKNHLVLGNTAFQNKDYKKAEEYFDLALTNFPNDERIFVKFIRSLLGQRKFLEAKNRLDISAQYISPAVELYRGLIASLFNEQKKSKEYFEKAKNGNDRRSAEKALRVLQAYEEFIFTTDGKIEHLQALLAEAFDEIGEYQMAITLGLDALKSKEDYRDAWIIIGHAYFVEKKYSDAKAALIRAIELDTSIPIAHFYLGLVLGVLEDHRGAIAELEKVESFGLDIGILGAEQKAKSFDALSEFEKAYDGYIRVLDEKGALAKPDEYLRPITIALENLHEPEKAHLLATFNFANYPKEPMSFYLLGWTEWETGKVNEGKEHLERALQLSNMKGDLSLEETVTKKLQSIQQLNS